MKASTGVTGPQRLVLRLVAAQPQVSPSDLARFLYFHKSTVTVILRSLERAKLVRRKPNATDRRAVVLELTPAGKRIAQQRSGTVEAAVRAALSRIPKREVETARSVLERVAISLV